MTSNKGYYIREIFKRDGNELKTKNIYYSGKLRTKRYLGDRLFPSLSLAKQKATSIIKRQLIGSETEIEIVEVRL